MTMATNLTTQFIASILRGRTKLPKIELSYEYGIRLREEQRGRVAPSSLYIAWAVLH